MAELEPLAIKYKAWIDGQEDRDLYFAVPVDREVNIFDIAANWFGESLRDSVIIEVAGYCDQPPFWSNHSLESTKSKDSSAPPPKTEQSIKEFLETMSVYPNTQCTLPDNWSKIVEEWAHWVRDWKPGDNPVIQCRSTGESGWADWYSRQFINCSLYSEWRVRPKPVRIRLFVLDGEPRVYTQYSDEPKRDPKLASGGRWVGDWHEVELLDTSLTRLK